MQDVELFLSLAEIAGVFVGFGALIAVRSGGASDVHEVVYMRAVVWMGMMTVVAALAPVTLGRYGLAEHDVWATSSVIVFVGYFGMVAFATRTPEVRMDQAARSRTFRVVEGAGTLLWAIATIVALGAIMLGRLPDLEAALYFTVVVFIMLGAGFTLLELVFAQRRPAVV
jgi:hypothetical protein